MSELVDLKNFPNPYCWCCFSSKSKQFWFIASQHKSLIKISENIMWMLMHFCSYKQIQLLTFKWHIKFSRHRKNYYSKQWTSLKVRICSTINKSTSGLRGKIRIQYIYECSKFLPKILLGTDAILIYFLISKSSTDFHPDSQWTISELPQP